MEQDYHKQIAEFYDRIGRRYHNGRLAREKLFSDFIEKPAVMRCVSAPKLAVELLDIGCGSGLYAKMFAQMGFNVTGLDLSKEMLSIAYEYCAGLPVKFLNVAFESFNSQRGQFDIVFGSFLLGYISNLTEAFEKIHYCLSGEGSVVLTMLHPVRTAATGREEDGYVVKNYFVQGIYYASILQGEERFPLNRHLISDVVLAAKSAGFYLVSLQEPLPQEPPEEIDASFYYRCPSLVVFEFRKLIR